MLCSTTAKSWMCHAPNYPATANELTCHAVTYSAKANPLMCHAGSWSATAKVSAWHAVLSLSAACWGLHGHISMHTWQALHLCARQALQRLSDQISHPPPQHTPTEPLSDLLLYAMHPGQPGYYLASHETGAKSCSLACVSMLSSAPCWSVACSGQKLS